MTDRVSTHLRDTRRVFGQLCLFKMSFLYIDPRDGGKTIVIAPKMPPSPEEESKAEQHTPLFFSLSQGSW